jgi:hypothetical protein
MCKKVFENMAAKGKDTTETRRKEQKHDRRCP